MWEPGTFWTKQNAEVFCMIMSWFFQFLELDTCQLGTGFIIRIVLKCPCLQLWWNCTGYTPPLVQTRSSSKFYQPSKKNITFGQHRDLWMWQSTERFSKWHVTSHLPQNSGKSLIHQKLQKNILVIDWSREVKLACDIVTFRLKFLAVWKRFHLEKTCDCGCIFLYGINVVGSAFPVLVC